MASGDSFVKSTSRKSLQLLGSVGEPINPEAWLWYFKVCGDSRCPIVDTWYILTSLYNNINVKFFLN